MVVRMTFRFVHTADLHLDSPLRSLALRNPELAALVRGATREALSAIVDLCIAEEVDALIVAGDLYDGSQTSMNTGLFLVGEFRRLQAAGIRVFLIRGNHDSASAIRRELSFPDNVHLFSGRSRSVLAKVMESGRAVHVHGIGFDDPHAPDSLLPRFLPPVPDAINIGLLHTSLAGAPGHDAYAPCSIADLTGHGFDYWALGHVHLGADHAERPAIIMPGIPQGRDINEAGEKGVVLVTVSPDGTMARERRRIGAARFERLPIDLTALETWRDMLARIAEALEGAARQFLGPLPNAQLILRLQLTGATPLAWRLRRDPDFLLDEVTSLAQSVPGCWVEKIEIDCVPALDGAPPTALDPAAELAALVERDVLTSHGFRHQAGEIMAELLAQLPRELKESFGTHEEAAQMLLARIGSEGSAEVLAHLRAEGDAAGSAG